MASAHSKQPQYPSATTSASSAAPNQVTTMPSFARALRTRQNNETVTSSIYSLPDPGQAPAARPSESQKGSVSHEQGAARPQLMERPTGMRVLTRKGKMLFTPREYQKEQERQAVETTKRNARGAASVRKHHRASLAILEGRPPEQPTHFVYSSALDDEQHHQAEKVEANKAKDNDTESWYPLDDIDLNAAFADPETTCNQNAQSSSNKPGLLRRMSDKVKKALTPRPTSAAPPKRSVSNPTAFRDLDPRYPGGGSNLHPDIKAIPLREAQKKFLDDVRHSQISAPLDNLKRDPRTEAYSSYPEFDAAPVLRTSARLADRSGPAKFNPGRNKVSEQAGPTKAPLKVTVVGDPDRDTLFGDFIDVSDSSSSGVGTPTGSDLDILMIGRPVSLPIKEKYSRPALVPEPLAPRRDSKASTYAEVPQHKPARRWVDPTTRSWMPPNDDGHSFNDIETIDVALDPNSFPGQEMVGDFPSVDDLFTPAQRRPVLTNAQGLEFLPATTYQPKTLKHQATRYTFLDDASDNGDGSPHIAIDTYDHGDHTTWITVERGGMRSLVYSDAQQIRHGSYDNVVEQDEAARIMERLERLRR